MSAMARLVNKLTPNDPISAKVAQVEQKLPGGQYLPASLQQKVHAEARREHRRWYEEPAAESSKKTLIGGM